jgi:hypothetical protein
MTSLGYIVQDFIANQWKGSVLLKPWTSIEIVLLPDYVSYSLDDHVLFEQYCSLYFEIYNHVACIWRGVHASEVRPYSVWPPNFL